MEKKNTAAPRYRLAAFADEAGPSLSEQIAALRRNGISLLEIRNLDGRSVADLTVEEARAYREQLAGAGISVWSIGSPYGKIGITEAFGPHLDRFCRGLELAEALGAGRIRLFSFYLPEGGDPSLYRDDVLERLARFCEKARGSGILLCHENEKGIYGDTAVRCADLHRSLPELRAVFDPANFIQCGEETLAAWALLSPYIEYMHIKDARAGGAVVPAGQGDGQLPELLRQYQGQVLTLEPHLRVFDGLAALEQAGKSSEMDSSLYETADAAFDAAAAALRALLEPDGPATDRPPVL